MAEDNLQFFQGTCEVFDLRTCKDEVQNQKFIDPCDCYKYYQCSNYNMLHQTCSEGTAWDSEKGCIHYQDVIFNQNCSSQNVWTRCNVTDSRLADLKFLCTGLPTSTSTETSSNQRTPRSDNSTSGNISPGVIVGSVIGGALIAVLVLIVAFCVYKRRKQKSSIDKKRSGTIAHNPEYFEGGIPDDPYAIINDSHVGREEQMNNPTYNGGVGGGTLSLHNEGFTNSGFNDNGDETVYDNSGAPIVGHGYTSTLRRSNREYDTPSRVMSSSQDIQSGETGSHETSDIGTDFNANREKMDERATDGGNTDNLPDYFVLEKEDDDHL